MQLQYLGHVERIEKERRAKRTWMWHLGEKRSREEPGKKSVEETFIKEHLADIKGLRRNEVMND